MNGFATEATVGSAGSKPLLFVISGGSPAARGRDNIGRRGVCSNDLALPTALTLRYEKEQRQAVYIFIRGYPFTYTPNYKT